DGRRAAFTFAPLRHSLPGLTYYTPSWVADPGVDYTLESAETKLIRGGDRLYDLLTARPYNPASGEFPGPEYALTAPDGTVYHLSTARGVEERISPSGLRLIYADSGIFAPDGHAIRFVRGAAGRIASIIAPNGSSVLYSYDAGCNLIAAREVVSGQLTRFGYASDDSHRLIIVTAPMGSGEAVEYVPVPHTLPITADLGSASRLAAVFQTGT